MIESVVLVGLAFGGALASWFDGRERRLPNWLCAGMALAGLSVAVWFGGVASGGWHALHAFVALLVGMGLFAAGVIGGGDAKYYAAVAAWFDPSQWVELLVAVAMSGLVVLAGWMVVRRLKRARSPAGEPPDRGSLPYGIAIALGSLIVALRPILTA